MKSMKNNPYTEVQEEAGDAANGSENHSPDLEVRRPLSRGHRPRIIVVVLSVLLAVTAVLFVVFVALYATKTSSSSSSSSGSDVCTSEACLNLAVQIKGAMDESINPCDDFYNFTCGNWPAFNKIPEDSSGTGVLTQQQYAVYSDLAEVLERDITGGNGVLEEVSDFYTSCITAMFMNDTDFAELVPVIRMHYQELGGWSLVGIPDDRTVWTVNSSQFIREKMVGSEAFYSLSVGFDQDALMFTLLIEQSGLSLGYPDLYYGNSTLMLFNEISLFLGELAQGAAVDEDKIQDIVDFETSLSTIWDYTDQSDDNITYTVEDLYLLWPYHDWLGVLQGIFEPLGVNVESSSNVTVTTPNYFRLLTNLVEGTPTETLENYAKWIMTWQVSDIFLPDSTIRESLILFRQSVLGEPSMDQQQQCVQIVENVLPLALGRVYAEYILPSGYKEAGMELVTQVRAGMKQRMMDAEWLDSETRQLALEKLVAIESRVAYPERTFDDGYLDTLYGSYDFNETNFIENYLQYIKQSTRQELSMVYTTLDRSVWLSNPTQVNAYYIPDFNQITILEAIMRAPVFSKEWPLSMQYGSLGVIVGHELTHGFDNNGRRYDKDGRRRMWWTKAAVEAFNNRTECFIDQYSEYELFGYSVDGNLTLGENIADNGGLRASYDAFKKIAPRGKNLPGLTNFTDDQLFFIAYGQLWCSYSTPYSFYVRTLNEHSPGEFRVIGALSNNEAFSKAFNCPRKSPMNPTNKCVLW